MNLKGAKLTVGTPLACENSVPGGGACIGLVISSQLGQYKCGGNFPCGDYGKYKNGANFLGEKKI